MVRIVRRGMAQTTDIAHCAFFKIFDSAIFFKLYRLMEKLFKTLRTANVGIENVLTFLNFTGIENGLASAVDLCAAWTN